MAEKLNISYSSFVRGIIWNYITEQANLSEEESTKVLKDLIPEVKEE